MITKEMFNTIGAMSARCGTTTWIIEAAINNPNVYIIGANQANVNMLNVLLLTKINKMNFLKKWLWKYKHHSKMPIIRTVEEYILWFNTPPIMKSDRPVILDNSVYYMD